MRTDLFVPFVALRFVDKLCLREMLASLGLDRLKRRGLSRVLPVYFGLFALISSPYVKFVAPAIESWTRSVPLFRIPDYSIFQDTPQATYSFPPVALVFLGIGNFLGEERYFRWLSDEEICLSGEDGLDCELNLLFALYHRWQVQQTWSMIGLALVFGLLMALGKEIYVLMAFHFVVNMWMAFGAG